MGIEGVSSRIGDIQSRIVALQTQQAPTAPKTSATTPAAGRHVRRPPLRGGGHQRRARYKLNSKGIPTDLAAYGNGKIPAASLEKVGATGHKLWAPAAEQLTSMIADAKKDGVTIGITDSYRSYDEQVDLAKRKGLYSQGGLAARPGTSDHGWGMAADLDLNAAALSWMRANGEKYGFVENVPRETWHWTYAPRSLLGLQARQISSPCSRDSQPSWSAAQARQAAEMRCRSSSVAAPVVRAWVAMSDLRIRSAHMWPHHARSSRVAKHHVLDVAVTSVRPAAWAQDEQAAAGVRFAAVRLAPPSGKGPATRPGPAARGTR